jgi:aminopeptidase
LIQKPVHSDYRVNHTKWVILRYPTSSMAQLAGMSTAEFERFYYDVCTLDYGPDVPRRSRRSPNG